MNKNKRPTISTVAAEAGLSVATVDRVLNARAPVNPETAERVFAAAEAVGYFAARLIGQRIRDSRRSYRFGILLLGTAQAFYANLSTAIASEAQRYGDANLTCNFDYIIDRTPATIATQIERLAAQNDGLAVVSFVHPLIDDAVARARASGVPVVALLSEFGENADGPYVGLDNHEVGRTLGWLIANVGGAAEGSVAVLMGGHRFLGHQARVDGLRGYLSERAPGLRLLEAVINLDNEDITEEATLDLLARHDDLRGLCVAGGGGDGIIQALAQLRERPRLCTVLLESTPMSRQALRQGLANLIVDSQPERLAAELLRVLVDLQGNGFDASRHRIQIPLQILTPENV